MILALARRTIAVAVLFFGIPGSAFSDSPFPSSTSDVDIKIVIVEGEDAVNIIQQRTAVAPIVEVRDDNDLPVAGVLLRFRINGKRAVFAGGALEITLTTDAAGRASPTGLQPVESGPYQIAITAQFKGETATTTITQHNFATVADAAKAGRTPSSSTSGAEPRGGAATTAQGGLSKAAIIGLVGAGVAGAAVAVAAAGGNESTPTPPVVTTPPPSPPPPTPPPVTNTAPTVGALTASRAVALQGMEVAFTAQASDVNNDPLTYAWAFGDGATSTEQSPRHSYTTSGTFTVRLTVSDGRESTARDTTIVIKPLTGTWSANAMYFRFDTAGNVIRSFPVQMILSLSQSANAVTGSITYVFPPNEQNPGPGTITGSVNRTLPTITILGRWPPEANNRDLVLSLEPDADADTMSGATALQSITFRRQ